MVVFDRCDRPILRWAANRSGWSSNGVRPNSDSDEGPDGVGFDEGALVRANSLKKAESISDGQWFDEILGKEDEDCSKKGDRVNVNVRFAHHRYESRLNSFRNRDA